VNGRRTLLRPSQTIIYSATVRPTHQKDRIKSCCFCLAWLVLASDGQPDQMRRPKCVIVPCTVSPMHRLAASHQICTLIRETLPKRRSKVVALHEFVAIGWGRQGLNTDSHSGVCEEFKTMRWRSTGHCPACRGIG
jgi:hypothetical protein